MKFAFEILWARNGSVEPLIDPAPVSFRSIETARDAAARFASHVPVYSITIAAEDGSLSERWSWSNGVWERQMICAAPPSATAD
jgi:hypothetical protein